MQANKQDNETLPTDYSTTKDKGKIKPIQRMPIKATPYRHQIAAFNFAMRIFGGKADDG